MAQRRGLAARVAAAALALAAPAAFGAGAASVPSGAALVLLDFSAEERAAIGRHGPWPPPARRDPGNEVAGSPLAQAVGRRLFSDSRLSPDGRIACTSCHQRELAFTDGRARSFGRAELDRNAPSIWNAVQQRWFGWDGATDSLWSQAIGPLTDPRELGSNGAHLRALIAGDPALARAWQRLFGRRSAAGAGRQHAAAAPRGATDHPAEPDPSESDEAALVQTAKVIGAFVSTLRSPRTPFDVFRDALARGDRRAAAAYPLAAQRGLRLFVGRGRCALCHGGPLFSNGEFADIGVGFFVRPGVVDAGRHRGIAALRASPYTLLGPHAVGAGGEAWKTRHVEPLHRNFGEFKVPSLRHVAQTAPYMHDGRIATLDDVLRHYDEIDAERLHADGERILRPLRLSAQERADLVAFLRTLSPGPPPPSPARIEIADAPAPHRVLRRQVRVWLPPGYDDRPARRYPVLYLHDGRNVFGGHDGRPGWGFDTTAERLVGERAIEPPIIVAVDHGDDRIGDYTPQPMLREGRLIGGGAAAYARYLVDELKPFIDSRYRTRRGAEHTAVGGSSLGGLVTVRLLLDEARTFGAGLVVSPSVWWAGEAIVRDVAGAALPRPRPRVWLDIGALEGREAVRGTAALRDALVARGWKLAAAPGRRQAALAYLEQPEATHDERSWAKRVEPMLRFLYAAR
jgi:cytochrome c peroxidase